MSIRELVSGIAAVVALLCTHSPAGMASTIHHDVDMDGTKDVIRSNTSDTATDEMMETDIVITLSSSATAINARLLSYSGINIYPGHRPGELVVDYSDRGSREAPEMSYNVYRWNQEFGQLCLYLTVDAIPPSQLERELVPSDVELGRPEGCMGLDGEQHSDAPTPKGITSEELRTYESQQIPQWTALEIAEQASVTSSQELLQIASTQHDLGNHAAAAVILEKLIAVQPDNTQALELLAEIYAAYGNTSRFCSLYGVLMAQGENASLSKPGNHAKTCRE